MHKRKLIEVALPMDAINRACAREKSIRHGHPSTLHLWWSRKPLAAARAVIWSSLVDDPSSHPERFPTEEARNKERKRLFGILEKLVVWENSNDEEVLKAARDEIMKSTDGNPPPLLDPFAGGGSIPLEAQRLGLEAHAHDLNPVAVMINKAMIEIPPRFADRPPVNPEARVSRMKETWAGAQGLAEDVRFYGEWLRGEAEKRIGRLYPKAKVPREQGGGEATVIAWLWARTVSCPNPACGCEMPLASSFVLSRKKGREVWAEPVFQDGRATFKIHHGGKPQIGGTVSRQRGVCPRCGSPVGFPYIREEAKAGRMGAQLVAVVAEGRNGRVYLAPDEESRFAANVDRPEDYPDGSLPNNPRWFSPPAFGMTEYANLFTPRQLTALTTFSDLVDSARERAEADALAAGLPEGGSLAGGGSGAKAYGEAVGVYLAFVVDKMADYHSAICLWAASAEKMCHTFARQAIPMAWDYAEANPFSSSSGCYDSMLGWVRKCVASLPRAKDEGAAVQADAQKDSGLRDVMISTDPPYYDNIGYADLSDFFYIWMRRSLKSTYPGLFTTMLAPKAEELIATPYRHEGGRTAAKEFFEGGMSETCRRLYSCARDNVPVTIYYAYKQQSEESGGTVSTGWETMLSAIIGAGFRITGTWPMRTERTGRMTAQETNALASSVVLVCRKRPGDAPAASRRSFAGELKRELKPALEELQAAGIAPVDLAQAAIGPGMAVFSRYSKVLDAEGKPVTVRDALQAINRELDDYFSGQDADIDRGSRFCVALYTQCAFNDMKYGDAETLARAKNVTVDNLAAMGVLSAKKGLVRLLERGELPSQPGGPCVWLLTQVLTRELASGGIDACARIVASATYSRDADKARALAYRLHQIAERKGWTQEALAYNSLVTSWKDIKDRADGLKKQTDDQLSMFNR